SVTWLVAPQPIGCRAACHVMGSISMLSASTTARNLIMSKSSGCDSAEVRALSDKNLWLSKVDWVNILLCGFQRSIEWRVYLLIQ
ncbi:hypothetical protein COCVIDRAFT_94580, partial [Bipolaris victoriae FI3]